jgi:DNA modification methylase
VVIGLNAELDTGIAMNLMLGDCLERMKEIPDGSVDLTVTSPPYDNLRELQ